MRPPRLLVLVLLVAIGCGGDPGTSRLSPGMAATAHGEGDEPVPVFFSGKTEMVPEGTVVKVVFDGEGDPSEPRRKVVVSIQEGPSKGLAGQMRRSDLRPGE